MIGDGSSRRNSGGGRFRNSLIAIVAPAIILVAVAGLGVQAFRGNRTVGVQRDARTIKDAALDNAFYNCISVQGHSLVAPDQSVALSEPANLSGLGSIVTLMKGIGSWAPFADPASRAEVKLSLRNSVAGGGTCLGTQVIGTYPKPHHHALVRVGSGSSVAGEGPPPAPPL